MTDDTLQGHWQPLAGKARTPWGTLTDDDLIIAKGTSECLESKIPERYGIARDAAGRPVRELAQRR